MARFLVGFAVLLLVAMAAVAEDTIFTTTTTFDEINPIRKRGSESGCYQQIMDQEMLSHCGMYLMKSIGQWSPRMGKPEEDHKQLCCMQLQNLTEECICPGIKMMLNQPMWSMMGQMMSQVASMAQNLPIQCNIMSESCQMRAVWF